MSTMVQSSGPVDQSPRRGPQPADWALASLIMVLHIVAPRTGAAGTESSSAWAGVLVLVMAVGQAAAVAFVRRYPVGSAVLVVTCYAGQSLVVGVIPPLAAWVVIWSLGSGRVTDVSSMKLPTLVAAVTSAVVVVAELTNPGSGASALLVLITVIVTLAAVLLRSERARIAAVRRQGGAEERLRIARDLHDLVGHGLSVVAIQSSTGRMALDAGDTTTARAAMSAVETSSRTAMAELRQMLGVLADGATDAPAPGIGDIPLLVDNVRAGGVDIDLEVTGSFDAVPRSTQLASYRIVQEGLTNTLRHSPGSPVRVGVRQVGDRLTVAVESFGGGVAPPVDSEGGSGLAGLRARVAALSGSLRSVPTADGWLLAAELPVSEPDTEPTLHSEGPG